MNVAKKEELLGEDTSRIDEAEYKLQSMVSPETHEANRFFNKPPSKEIGSLRVDTMSPAQVSFIQSSTQWHKYYKPSSPTPYTSNIYPEDPVLYPGFKSFKGSYSNEREGYTGGLEGLPNEGAPRQHHMNYEWNTNSYGSYGDTGVGDQPQKDYENNPFSDKSWWNSKSEGKSSPDGYESLDGKTLAVPEPKNDQELTNQDELSGPISHFASRSREMLEGGGLGNMRQHLGLPGDEKASFMNKLDNLKENGVIPQDEGEKVFFNGNQKLLEQSGVASPPLDPVPGPSQGIGRALAEELLQKNRGKFRDEGESTNILQGIHEAASVLRSGGNEFDESQFLSKPLLDEKGVQRTTMYRNGDFDSDRGHVVLIRSHQVTENTAKKHITEHTANLENMVQQKDLAGKRNNQKSKQKHIIGHVTAGHKVSAHESKLKATKKSITSPHKRLCKKCSFPSPLKKLSLKIHRPLKDR